MFRAITRRASTRKFRLKLPAEFKRRVDEVYGPLFYITSVDGKRAQVVPDEGVGGDRGEDGEDVSRWTRSGRDFLDVTSYYGQMAEMDSQGRLLIAADAAGAGEVDGRCECAGDADVSGGGEHASCSRRSGRRPDGVVETVARGPERRLRRRRRR